MENVGVKPSGVTMTIGGAIVNPTGGTLTQSREFLEFTAMDDTCQQQVPDETTLGGTYSVDFYVNSTHAALLGKISDSTASACTLVLTDSDSTGATTTASFDAYVSNINISVGQGQASTGSCEVTLDSDITWS